MGPSGKWESAYRARFSIGGIVLNVLISPQYEVDDEGYWTVEQWIVQCVEYDMCSQGFTPAMARDRFKKQLATQALLDKERGREFLADVQTVADLGTYDIDLAKYSLSKEGDE